MKAINYKDGKVQVFNEAPPTGEGVLVNIYASGICGTDIHLFSSGLESPHIAGHELSGVTEDGKPVAIEPYTRCGKCKSCNSGDSHLCNEFSCFGVNSKGGMTEQMIVPEYCLVPLVDEIQIKDACLIEPLAVAFHGLVRTETKSHHRVAIVGAGSIGLCSVAAARYIGCEVGLYAKYDHQMQAGEKLGASPIKGTYDRVIDCAGTSGIMELCQSFANPAAWIILLSVYWDQFDMPGIPAFSKELKIFPSMMYGCTNGVRDIDEAAKILAKNPKIGDIIISHRFPLEAAEEAFETALNRKSGAIKVVFDNAL